MKSFLHVVNIIIVLYIFFGLKYGLFYDRQYQLDEYNPNCIECKKMKMNIEKFTPVMIYARQRAGLFHPQV